MISRNIFITNLASPKPFEEYWPRPDFTRPDWEHDPYNPWDEGPLITVLPIGDCGNGPRQCFWPKHRDYFQLNRVAT